VLLRVEVPAEHPSADILGTERMGTGALVEPAGHILTAHYLLMGASSIEVTLITGASRPGHVLGIDYDSGLGVIAGGDEVPRLSMRSSEELAVGQEAFLVAGVDDGRRVNSGIVTSLGGFEAFWEYLLDRAITLSSDNPGLGGGPLLDTQGRMVGVVALSLAEVGRFTLAIPSERAHPILDEIDRNGSYAVASPRAWLGLTCYTLRDHVVLAGLVPGGPADQAGLKAGDVVLSFDGEAVDDRRALYTRLWTHAAGEPIRIRIFRSNQAQEVQVVSGSIEDFFA
jgi:S1-C subfamily serine protease